MINWAKHIYANYTNPITYFFGNFLFSVSFNLYALSPLSVGQATQNSTCPAVLKVLFDSGWVEMLISVMVFFYFLPYQQDLCRFCSLVCLCPDGISTWCISGSGVFSTWCISGSGVFSTGVIFIWLFKYMELITFNK